MEAAISQQENLRIVQEAFAALNAHDVDRYAAMLDESCVEGKYARPLPVRGRTAARAAMQEYLRVFPDLHFDLDLMVASDDQVVTRWLVSGTYGGASMSSPPSDRHVKEHGCTLSTLRRTSIVQVWHYWDTDHLPSRQAGQ